MKDIIALARAAGFKITEHRTGVFIDAPSPCNITVASILALHEEEIRKEFEEWFVKRGEVIGYNQKERMFEAWQAAKSSTPQPQTVRDALEQAALIAEQAIGVSGSLKAMGEIPANIRALIAPLSAADSVAVQEPVAWIDDFALERLKKGLSSGTELITRPDGRYKHPLFIAAPTLDKE